MIDGKRGGTIINIASSEGLRAAPEFAVYAVYAVYAACKAAIINFTRTMALELSAHGIRVHALAPDMIATKGLQSFFDVQGKAGRVARDHYIPMQRLGSVEEIGSAAVFLASKMSSYLTGLTIPVDAGARASSGWSSSVRTGEWNLYHW